MAPGMTPGTVGCPHLTLAQMQERLRALRGDRTLVECAEEWGVNFREISKVLKGRQYPGEKLQLRLGLREELVYVYRRMR